MLRQSMEVRLDLNVMRVEAFAKLASSELVRV